MLSSSRLRVSAASVGVVSPSSEALTPSAFSRDMSARPADLEEFPAREASVSHSLHPSLAEQPLVVGVVLDLPLAYRSCHDVEVVQVVAWRRRDHVVTLRHEHHIAVMERQGLVERAVFGIDSLQREAFVWTDLMVVRLLQVSLVRWVIPVVFVRRVARPVAVRGQDLAHKKPLRRSVLHQDRTYLPLHVASAAYLDLDILGPDQHRIRSPLGRRRSNGDLQIRHGFYPVVRAWRQVECIGSAVEHALAAPDLCPLLITSGYLTRSGERDQADFLTSCMPAGTSAWFQPQHLETDVLPARGPGRDLCDDAVGVRLTVAAYEQAWHSKKLFPINIGVPTPCSPRTLREPRPRTPSPRPRRQARPRMNRSQVRPRSGQRGCGSRGSCPHLSRLRGLSRDLRCSVSGSRGLPDSGRWWRGPQAERRLALLRSRGRWNRSCETGSGSRSRQSRRSERERRWRRTRSCPQGRW